MGLFSSKTKIYVASSVYNLAGDIHKRPNYLKTTVIGNIVSKSDFSMGDTITDSYLNGPGIRLRRFPGWAATNYDPSIGIAYGNLSILSQVNPEVVKWQVPQKAGYEVQVQSSRIGFGDFEEWADKFLYENYPDRITEKFEIDIMDDDRIVLTATDGSELSFYPKNFSQDAMYLYVNYYYIQPTSVAKPVVHPVVSVSSADDLPSTSEWTQVSQNHTPKSATLKTVTHIKSVFSDGRPDEESTNTEEEQVSWTNFSDVYEKDFREPSEVGLIIIRKTTMTLVQTGTVSTGSTTNTEVIDLGGGVTETRTTTVTTDTLGYTWSYQNTDVVTTMSAGGMPQLFIYKQHSGNAILDSLFINKTTNNRFYSFIPIRSDKNWISGSTYTLCKRAFKKATGGKISAIMGDLKKNKDIGDIQYIYAVFGCSLNSPENAAKEYIYRFFQLVNQSMPADPNYPTMDALVEGFAQATRDFDAYQEWWKSRSGNKDIPIGKPPKRPVYPTIPSKSINIRSNGVYRYNMTISWNFIEESVGSGKAFSGAKKGQLKFAYEGTVVLMQKAVMYSEKGNDKVGFTIHRLDKITMYWQDGDNSWRKISVYGLNHNNNVYKNKSVSISGVDALNDDEESGFIIPLHNNIYRSMSLVNGTQLSTACCYLVLNSYKKVKKKWYQSGIFKVVVVVVAVVVSVFFTPAAGAGVMGTAASIGAALGFAGLAAIIVGAVANAIAAMILMSIIQTVSVSLLGDKIGIIVATIASMVAMNVGTALSTGSSMSTMLGEMMKADNIIKLTSSVGNGISDYINASAMETVKKTEKLMAEYRDQMKTIQEKYEEMFGTEGMGYIDPMNLTNVGQQFEPLDSFLSRTLMTGHDIADMSNNMITNFADITLQLDLDT